MNSKIHLQMGSLYKIIHKIYTIKSTCKHRSTIGFLCVPCLAPVPAVEVVLPAPAALAAYLLFVVCELFGSAGHWWWWIFASLLGVRQGYTCFS